MRKSLITIVILIGIISSSFANTIDPAKGDSTKTTEETLTLNEQQLLDQLEVELAISLDDVRTCDQNSGV